MIPFGLLMVPVLLAEAPAEAPKKPPQMEIKGTLTSIPVPKKLGEWKGSRAVSDPFLGGKAQYRIPLRANQSILAEVKSERPILNVLIVEARGTDTRFDNLPQTTEVMKNQALYINKQKRAMDVLVLVWTRETVSAEPYTLVLTEIDTDAYLKELETAKKPTP